jgi:hypothetical protein
MTNAQKIGPTKIVDSVPEPKIGVYLGYANKIENVLVENFG